MLPKVAIVIVTYNAAPYLDEVLFSLERLDYPKEQLEIIVVDNASTDGTPERLHQVPGITFFPSGENLGFAAGNNLGIEHAILNRAEFVYLLNHDAKMDSHALQQAIVLAQTDDSIGSVQSRIMLWKDPERLNATGGMVHFLGFGFVRDNGRWWRDVHHEVTDGEEITFSSGAAVLYRASVLRKVGLLDPFLFLYHEDLELGWRIRLAGYKNILSVDSVVYHDYEFKRSIQKFYWMERNRLLVHFSHLKWRTLLLLLPFLLCLEVALIPFALKGGWLKEKIFVYANVLSPKTWDYIRKKRRESLLIRQRDDQEILRLFTGKILHQETSNMVVEWFANPLLNMVFHTLQWIIRW